MNMFAVLGLLLITVIITALVVAYFTDNKEHECACDNELKLATASPASSMLREDPAIVKPMTPSQKRPGGRVTTSNTSRSVSNTSRSVSLSGSTKRAAVSGVSTGKGASSRTAR